jgi:hypothetical protein
MVLVRLRMALLLVAQANIDEDEPPRPAMLLRLTTLPFVSPFCGIFVMEYLEMGTMLS